MNKDKEWAVTQKKAPKSFAGFRRRMAAAMRKVGINPLIANVVGDTNYEGGPIPNEVFRQWEAFKDAYDAEKGRYMTEDEWLLDAEAPVHDCVINLVCDYWPKEKVNCRQWAEKVLREWGM